MAPAVRALSTAAFASSRARSGGFGPGPLDAVRVGVPFADPAKGPQQMCTAQLDRGQVLAVLGVAGVVVTDQRAGVAGQNRERVQGGVAAVVGGAEPDQPSGAGGVDVV